jgi:hypothetical protein
VRDAERPQRGTWPILFALGRWVAAALCAPATTPTPTTLQRTTNTPSESSNSCSIALWGVTIVANTLGPIAMAALVGAS